MDSEIFNFRLEYQFLPDIKKNSLVVMDNASFHKSEKTKKLAEKFSCRLLFLPPYSHNLNQIENFLASLKAKIKKISGGIKSLSVCVEAFFQTI